MEPIKYKAKIVSGYGVASGKNNDPRYPFGTLAIQQPYFLEQGLDLSLYYQGTLNINIAPLNTKILKPKYFFKQIAWSPHIPPENFYFFDVRLHIDNSVFEGFIYMPDPATKNDHFQDTAILELILPKIEGINYNQTVYISVNKEQLLIF